MKLVIGGAYQGKQSYASKTYNLTNPDWPDLHDRRSENSKSSPSFPLLHPQRTRRRKIRPGSRRNNMERKPQSAHRNE